MRTSSAYRMQKSYFKIFSQSLYLISNVWPIDIVNINLAKSLKILLPIPIANFSPLGC
jgi:hypothetical protein